jgi:hypothetical protein
MRTGRRQSPRDVVKAAAGRNERRRVSLWAQTRARGFREPGFRKPPDPPAEYQLKHLFYRAHLLFTLAAVALPQLRQESMELASGVEVPAHHISTSIDATALRISRSGKINGSKLPLRIPNEGVSPCAVSILSNRFAFRVQVPGAVDELPGTSKG